MSIVFSNKECENYDLLSLRKNEQKNNEGQKTYTFNIKFYKTKKSINCC